MVDTGSRLGLCDTCPQVAAARRSDALAGQASHNPKQERKGHGKDPVAGGLTPLSTPTHPFLAELA